MEQLTEILVNGLFSLACATVLYVVAKTKNYIEEATQKVKDERQQAIIEKTLGRLNNMVEVAVKDLENTVGKELREQVKDGKLDSKELLQLKEIASEKVFKGMSVDTVDILNQGVGDVADYVDSLIEVKLEEVKQATVELKK